MKGMTNRQNHIPAIALKFFFPALALICCAACERTYDPFSPEANNDTDIASCDNYMLTVAGAMEANCRDHEAEGDETWDSNKLIHISLQGNSIAVDGGGTSVNGTIVTIKSAGSYLISGTLEDGQLIVDTEDKSIVSLILDNADISCSSSAAIYIVNSEKTVIILAPGSENQLADGSLYIYEDTEEDEPNAALFSKDDLTICGSGNLSVNGNYNDGIAGKDGLIIKACSILVNAVDDGIRGKDYLIIKGAGLRVKAGGDGLKSDNDEDATKGYIWIESGTIDITSGGDAIQAETDLLISEGDFTLVSGGGSSGYVSETISAKGIKASLNTVIDGGNLTVDASDDAIHSNATMSVNAGMMLLSTGDDGFHADSILGINGGNITITECYEGIESAVIAISDGIIHIACSDDGLNVAGGGDGSGRPGGPGGPGWQGTDQFSAETDYYLYINGGYVAVNASRDGIDANGAVLMTGGKVLIDGPVSNMNGALDFETFRITGGFLLGTGSAGMAEAPGSSSTQYSLLARFQETMPGGTLVHLQAESGAELFTYQPSKSYQSVVFSSPDLKEGSSYTLYTGGSTTGTLDDGLLTGGDYTPGNRYTGFTIKSILTTIF
jgi:hypothetical protein